MKVLIVGAGAIGIPLGYMLMKRDRNEVTFLVRREQATEVKLYSYDKKKTFTYGDIKSLSTELLEEKEEVEEIEGSEAGTNQAVEDPFAAFDLVILTLPSDVLYSEAGVTLMKRLNSRLQKSAIYVVLPPGFGMQERVFTPAGITRAQIAYGLPLFLCHDTKHEVPVDEQYKEREGADFAYHYLVSSGRILLLSRRPTVLKRALRSASTGSIYLGEKLLEASTAMFLILNLLLYLQAYPKSLRKKDPSFDSALSAFWQIMNQYGAVGFMMKVFIGKNTLKLTDSMNRSRSKPLTVDFLKYHHGEKVREQNIQVIEMYIAAGEKKKRKVDKVKDFVALCRS